MSGMICPSKILLRRVQDAETIKHPMKRKLMAPYLKAPTSPEEDQPLDFSTKKTATPCQEPELRQSTDIPSPAIADQPAQSVRHHSPEESVLNSLRFRDSSASSSESSPPTPPSLPPSSVSSTPRSSSSPNGVPTMFEGISLYSQHNHRYLPPTTFPYSIAALMPTSQQFLNVDTSPVLNRLSHGSPIAFGTTVTGDSKFLQSPGMYPHFGSVSSETLNGHGINNLDSSVASILSASEKKGGKTSRPFKTYPNESLPLSLPPNLQDMMPYSVSPSRDHELRFAKYAEQLLSVKRRTSNGHQSKLHQSDDSKTANSGTTLQAEESIQMGSNGSGSDGSPSNGNGQSAVTSTGPSTSDETTKRKNRTLPDELKDEAYWERRRKNNEAAKRSRDARRAKEDEIAMRCSYLQNENLKLRAENEALRLHLRTLTAHISR